MALSVALRPRYYEVWGNLEVHFLVSNSRIFNPFLPVLWGELRHHPSTVLWSAYSTFQGGLMERRYLQSIDSVK